jgi:membrane-associated phospholipid phosphatase
LRGFLKDNFLILLLYLLAAGTAATYIFFYDKTAISLYINRFVGNRMADAFFYYITYFGDGRMAGLILLGILLYNVRLGIYALFSFLSATIIATSLKYLYFDDVHRPFYVYQYIERHAVTYVEGVDLHIHNSFPSGHATQVFAILMCVAFVSQKQYVKVLLFFLAFLTSLSRVYLSQHWLADITAGSFIGLLFSVIYYYVFIYRNKFQKLNRSLFTFTAA